MYTGCFQTRRQPWRTCLNFKKSNIRIWIHQRNLGNLQQVVWEGNGSKLLPEHSNNPKIKKFLDAVPHIMGLVKEIHADVINDNIEALKSRRAGGNIPSIVYYGKDANGLTPLHKAAGLGRSEIAEYLLEQSPKSIDAVDNEGRTPLHYSSLLKDSGEMANFLIENGADESALDSKQKTAAYYKTRASELDAKLLQVIPECPKTAKGESYLSGWDWSILASSLSSEDISKPLRKARYLINNNKNDTDNHIEEHKENGKTETNIEENEKDPVEVQTENYQVENVNGNHEEDKVDEQHENDNNNNSGPLGSAVNDETLNNDVEENNKDSEDNIEKMEDESHDEITNVGETEEHVSEDNNQINGNDDQPIENRDNNHDDLEKEYQNGNEETVSQGPSPVKRSRPSSTATTKPMTGTSDEDETKEEPNSIKNSAKSSKNSEVDPEGVIEGVVDGADEVEVLNKDGSGSAEDEEVNVDDLIESGNMEKLAGLVLSGRGKLLEGKKSDNPELQAFLDNVPVYMGKINRIHQAARDGSLRDLQAALDRRKFAIAKDAISPDGASPLHVAIIFGNTSIVRYLAGRFPETLQEIDVDGRTPLHYAATIADNSHYYNLLIHLGSDMRAQDKFGHTPEYYKGNNPEMTHRSLLEKFGEAELANEMLSDKVTDDIYSARKSMDDEDMLEVLEKCFHVIHGRRNSHTSTASTNSELSQNGYNPATLVPKHLKRQVFDQVRLGLTRLDNNLYDVIWPAVKKLPTDFAFRVALEEDLPLGIIAPDFYVYKVFRPLMEPLIKNYNNINQQTELYEHPATKFVEVSNEGVENKDERVEIELDLDPNSKWIVSGSMECTRNLEDYEAPKSLTVNQLESVERILTSIFLSIDIGRALFPKANDEELSRGNGTYYTLNEILEEPSEIRSMLASKGLLIPLWNTPDSDRLHGRHWPYGRGVFVSNAGNLAAWINVLDHLRIVTSSPQGKPGNIGQIYSRIYRLMSIVDQRIISRKDFNFGYLSVRPTTVGNTIRFNFTIKFPQLIKEPQNLQHLCLVRGLNYHRLQQSERVQVSNQQTVGITELQTFEDFSTAVANIIQLERDLEMTNSIHIAAMFVKIFRRKKAPLSAQE
ncbi:uncharacterized protein LOC123681009 isoform X3 [Harmonia axyridis]|uniref:uncharacterized protein LOC123681009 isoform X3 n=1 Tax=Harmonia axyridis TaxID=115357 RepID=UPI001E2795DC|nr:uncharacterized protein LOC123681009 isoform X3 [Harmonia axyridis]